MAIWDNFKNALRPYDDDDYIENEASEEETAAFEDIPEDWVCPLCGVGKEDFSVVEE